MAVSDIGKDEFDKEVLHSKTPVVVDFWAEWCGPCRVFSPIVEELSEELGAKVKFYKLNVDDNPEVAERFNVMSIPTAILFEKGEVKAVSIGALPKESLKKWVSTNM
ncbi:MAG: thioredoxin [Candidatus Micrarchaeota archaeon]|nr:thioredoxin [Candidatus Micrarchaeota archaeon]MDE1804955.1 thioredoxin [Candidatus Micrarchaeota archaeon]MDE1846818.1 thioredoxin [Candidatus Micrarchaeota archaeon]